MGLYFNAKGLIKTRYNEQEVAAVIVNKLPTNLSDSKDILPSFKISIMAPLKPSVSPMILFFDILSLSRNVESTNTIIGVDVKIKEELMTVVKFKPSKNNIWLKATPQAAHNASFKISFLLTFSLIKKL